MRRTLRVFALLLVVAAVAALATAVVTEGASEGERYEIVLDNAFGLNQGGDFRVAGVRSRSRWPR